MRALCQSAVLLSVVFVSWFLSASAGNSDCSKKVSACSCKGSKISIDLSEVLAPFQNGGTKVTDPNDADYYYVAAFCSEVKCDDTGNAAACQYKIQSGESVATLGKFNKYEWSVDASNPDFFYVMYNDGTPAADGSGQQTGTRRLKLEVNVVDTNPDAKVTFVKEDTGKDSSTGLDTHTYIFSLNMQRQSSGGGGSKVGIIGLVIMILFLVAILLYLIIGGIVNYKVKGATGTEIIPNYLFWKMIPIFIKDGFMLAISPCLKLAGRESSGRYQAL